MQAGHINPGKNPGKVAMATEKEEHEGISETLHLLRSPANAACLLRSVESADARRPAEHEPVEAPPAHSPD
jgi:antitoxin YefM